MPEPTSPPLLFDEWSWQLKGSCREHPLDLFFPDARGRRLLNTEEKAKSICRSCLVMSTCRTYALRAQESHGIWGALTSRERANLLCAQP
jgi:WhiB family redox-sensing transcriptional regulator